MKTTNDASATPATRRARGRRPDRSLFAGTETGGLLPFEDQHALAFARAAADTAIQPANDLERLFTAHLARNFQRTTRASALEAAAIEVEMSKHREAAESRWGKLDPESLYHLATRDPTTRAILRESSISEGVAFRRLRDAPAILKTLRSK